MSNRSFARRIEYLEDGQLLGPCSECGVDPWAGVRYVIDWDAADVVSESSPPCPLCGTQSRIVLDWDDMPDYPHESWMGGGAIASRRCSFIKPGGERCKGIATGGATLCYSHDPARAEERSRNASKAGKAGGNGRPSSTADVAQARSYTKGLISQLLRGDVPRQNAAVAFMGINTLMRVVEMERRIREQDELEVRLEALERRARVEQSTWQSRHRR